MTQSTLDDDDLFSEAASEMREDVESSLERARDALPAATDVWDVESENTLGVLNKLSQSLDTEDAAEHLRDAKKWHAMGTEADAFDDAEDLEEEIETIEELFADMEAVSDKAGDLASTVPGLKDALEEAEDDADAETAEA